MKQPTDAITITYRGEQATQEAEAIRQAAARQGTSLAKLIRRVLKEWLKGQGGGK